MYERYHVTYQFEAKLMYYHDQSLLPMYNAYRDHSEQEK